MTAEPKFVPEDAVNISLDESTHFNVRMIDCVGYMIESALGQLEGEAPRMVSTPWFDHEVSLREAAETGTQKVITEHSTIGIVVTTDGSVSDIPREAMPEPRSASWKNWMRWASPTSSCSTAPTRMRRRRSSWPRAWPGTTTTPCCR